MRRRSTPCWPQPALSRDDRELLLVELAIDAENEPKDSGYDEYWEAELRRRLKELDDSEAGLVDWEDARRFILRDGEDD